jgi:serine/threonine-protein kinase
VKAVLVLFGAALAGYLLTWVAYPAPLIQRDHAVARVLGLPLEQAQQQLSEQGFRVKVDGEESDPVVPAGAVLWQDPPPELIATRGTPVRLVVSSGPALIAVPDLASFYLDQAARILLAAGLRVGEVDTIASAAEAGVIVATRPGGGPGKLPGSSVDLVVSRGPANIRVPNVVGLKQEEARDRLEAVGLRVGRVSRREVRRGGRGVVLDQRPNPGTLSAKDGRVDLVVSETN